MRVRSGWRAVAALAVAMAGVRMAAAEPLSGLSAFAEVAFAGPYGTTLLRDDDICPSGVASSYISGQYRLAEPGQTSAFYGEAQSTAAFGTLTAYSWAWVSQDGAVLATDHLAYASATFSDTLTISDAGGGNGFVRYWFSISGNTSREYFRAEAQALLTVRHGPGAEFPGGKIVVGQTAGTGYLPFTFGKPMPLTVTFDAWVQIISNSNPYTGYGWCNFRSGVRLAGIQVFDSSLHPISSYTIKAASGSVYPVPEPASASALGVPLLVFTVGPISSRLRKPCAHCTSTGRTNSQ